MAGISFTSSGATPGISGSTLANAQRLGLGSGLSINPTGQVTNFHSPAANALNAAQSSTPAPSTPVKKTSVTMPDGSSHVTEYHAPPTDSTSNSTQSTPKQYNPSNGGVTNIGGVNYQAGVPVSGYSSPAQPNGQPVSNPVQSNTQPISQPAPTFPGTVSGLINTANTGSSAAQGYTQNTADYGAGNIPIGNEAGAIAKDYGERIARVGQQGASFEGGQRTTGTSPVAEGNAAVTAQTTAASQQALAAGESAALEGTQQELTGQNQAANAANEAAGQATTAQGQKISGLTSAGNLTQPTATSQGQTVFNPATGTFEGGSYQGNLATIVQSIKNGSIGYTAGVDSLSGLSPTAKADVLAALGPGFDTVASDANASAKGSNIQTGGTAVTGANAGGLADSIKQETTLNTAANNAQALATQVSDALKSTGLDLTNSTDANTAINNLQSRLGNDAYTKLNIAVNDARNAYQAILTATGATPTDAGTAANQNINANMSPKQILAAIDQLSQGVSARQQSQHQQTVQYQKQLSESGSNGSANGTGVVQTKVGAINTSW